MLKPKQAQAAALLAQGKLCREAAEAVEISPQTLSAWRKDPEFDAEVNAIRREVLDAAVAQMQQLVPEAIGAVGEVMKSGESDSVRLRAAAMVLAHVGLTDPHSGHWAWGIGPTTPEKVAKNQADELKLEQLMNSLKI